MKDFLDLYGEPFKFNYDGKYLFKTFFSSLMSILFIIVALFYFFFNLYRMFQHYGLIINSFQTTMDPNELYTFNQNNFLAFQMISADSDMYFFEKSSNYSKYFELSAYYFYNNSYERQLNILECDLTVHNKLPYDARGLLCLDLNNTKMEGNYYYSSGRTFVYIILNFNYTGYMQDYNYSIEDLKSWTPLGINVYFPITKLDLLNYDPPFTNTSGANVFQMNLNYTKFLTMSTQMIEINTDSSFLSSNTNTLNLFTSNYKVYSEDWTDNSGTTLLAMHYYLDPAKSVYFRQYMKFQDVLNNVSSVANILFTIFGIFCRRYNQYKLKVDFIQENIIYKLENQIKKDSIDMFIQEEPIQLNPINNPIEIDKNINPSNYQHLGIIGQKEPIQINHINNPIEIDKNRNPSIYQHLNIICHKEPIQINPINNPIEINKNRNPNIHSKLTPNHRFIIIPGIKIKMKSFFNSLLCCKNEDTILNFKYSDAADDFYEKLVDVKSIFKSITHFEDLKKAWLKSYQTVILNNSKIILDPNNQKKEFDENLFLSSFEKIKKKIRNKKCDEVDIMLVNKF